MEVFDLDEMTRDMISALKERQQNHDRMIASMNGQQTNIKALHTGFPDAYLEIARVLYNGRAKYGGSNHTKISTEDHINHAVNHCLLFLAGDTSETHLTNAAARLVLALSNHLRESNHD